MLGTGKLWIILNPTAGKGKAAQRLPVIEHFLRRRKENFEIICTTGPGDALEVAQTVSLGEYDIVVAAGGDGTCNEVVNGLLRRGVQRSRPPILGILPIGRGNDFASTPGIPDDIHQALAVLVRRKICPLDVGMVTGGGFPKGRYFINGVGIGFDTKVGFEAAKMNIKSGIAYVLGAIITFARFEPAPVLSISYGENNYDENDITLPAIMVSIVNGRRMGGSFFMGPNALLDDGLLDLCIVRCPPNRRKLVNIVFHYLSGTQSKCEGVSMCRATHFHLRALKGGMAAHCDGETVCYNGTELHISCVPGALSLIGV